MHVCEAETNTIRFDQPSTLLQQNKNVLHTSTFRSFNYIAFPISIVDILNVPLKKNQMICNCVVLYVS